MQEPFVVAIDMGYGHLRPALSLAELLGVSVYEADVPPLAQHQERRLWGRVRRGYELISRTSQLPLVGAPLRSLLDTLTSIPPLYPKRDLSAATGPIKVFRRLAEKGLGQGLANELRTSGAPLLTTFYAPALLSEFHGCDNVYCVVTDSDVNRVWAPIEPQESNIHYLVPTPRTRRRLTAYGVPPEQINVTGFPLPHSLLGGPALPALKENLKRRLVRLDPRGNFREQSEAEVAHFLGPLPADQEKQPVHVVFAVGGAGAQAGLAKQFLPSLAAAIRRRKIRVTLVAGRRAEVAAQLQEAIESAGLEQQQVSVLHREDLFDYLRAFNTLLAETDVLWTKPSEMTFYAALGLPLVLSWPVGVHERYNRRWAIEHGAAIKQRDPRFAGEWLRELIKDGTLAAVAWAGYTRLPKHGLYQIVEKVIGDDGLQQRLEGRTAPVVRLQSEGG